MECILTLKIHKNGIASLLLHKKVLLLKLGHKKSCNYCSFFKKYMFITVGRKSEHLCCGIHHSIGKFSSGSLF